MALVPRSSLRSLVLLVSHGRPQLSSFFSSSTTAAPQAAPGGDCPASDPPAAPVWPSRSSHSPPLECPDGTFKHVADRPSTCVLEDDQHPSLSGLYRAFQPVNDKLLSDTSEDPKYDITVDPKGLCNTLQPDTEKPSPGAVTDPSGSISQGSGGTPVTNEAPVSSPDIFKDPKHPEPEGPGKAGMTMRAPIY